MDIRHAKLEDIPGIVSLLKKSLGETLMPKTEAFWKWKHVDNPFGESPVLLALEKDEIIGVRAFMRWQWEGDGKIYKAIRAVDTATHPDHQGKGIFKKLTLRLVEQCKDEGVDFVFNTPNEQSRPGYLKMGWESAGRLPVSFKVLRPFSIAKNLITALKPQFSKRQSAAASIEIPPIKQTNDVTIKTSLSSSYLDWRYRQIPNIEYRSIIDKGAGSFIIYRIKAGRLGNELRICDTFATSDTYETLISRLQQNESDCDYITAGGLTKKLPGIFAATVVKGPIVTIRNLNMTDTSSLLGFNKWAPELGDLEVF
jgi:GNAT superfamily N-acetyltransferase